MHIYKCHVHRNPHKDTHTQTQKINTNNKSEVVLCLLKIFSEFVHLLNMKTAIVSSQTLCIGLCNKLKKISFY